MTKKTRRRKVAATNTLHVMAFNCSTHSAVERYLDQPRLAQLDYQIGVQLMQAAQTLPLSISESDMHLLLVTPMPGIKPSDISITITGRSVKISGGQTGLGEDDKNLLNAEWNMGPYYREVQLTTPVSGSLTNATFGNGILTLAMPKVKCESDCSAVTFQLELLEATRGERIGHRGLGVLATDIGVNTK